MKINLFFSLIFLIVLLFLLLQNSCKKDQGLLPQAAKKVLCDSVKAKYSTDIIPIIQNNCAIKGCHNTGGSGNGDFTTYAGVSSKADAPVGNGSMRKRALEGNPTWMPSVPLPDSLKQKLDCWLQQGAPNN